MSKTILLIEDDADSASGFTVALEQKGFQVILAKSRDEAAQAIESHKIDVIVMDYWMTGQSALTFMDKVCQLPTPPPVVMISAQPNARHMANALQASFLQKPFNADALVEAVQLAKTL